MRTCSARDCSYEPDGEKFYGEKLNSICSDSSIAAGLLQNFGSILLKSFS
jgi:hypothetical protein